MADFPNQVNTIQAPAVEGDFATANPRATVLAGEGALVSGNGVINGALVSGIVVGRFGWLSYAGIDSDNAPAIVNTFGAGLPAGLVHREQIGLITAYLATSSMVLLKGQQAVLFNSVDLWIKNTGAALAQVGMKAFANFADGTAYFAAAGATPPGGSGSASSIAAATFTATGSIADNVLTVTNVGAGSLYGGATFSGTGVATGTQIVSQLTSSESGGALAGKGTYALSIPGQTVASTTLSGTYGVLTIGGTVVAGLGAGQTISGSSVVTGTKIYQQLTGTTGAAGTYVVDNNTVVSSTAITSQASIETKWICRSSGATNELVKVSDTV
jgi:hypothetical protein